MPLRKLAEKLEQDVSHLRWQAKVYGLSSSEITLRYQRLAGDYRKVVAPEDLADLEQLLVSEADKLG